LAGVAVKVMISGWFRWLQAPGIFFFWLQFNESGTGSLIRLCFNLYNGWSDRYTTPLSILSSLDSNNLKLAGNAIMIRLDNRQFLEELGCGRSSQQLQLTSQKDGAYE